MSIQSNTIHRVSRRSMMLGGVGMISLTVAGARHARAQVRVTAYRNPGCGCCEQWSLLMKAAGFDITMADDEALAARKAKLGVPEHLAGCHTALIGSYVFEGHVPPRDIIRFLREMPDALGLAVAGMPVGSPGMEQGEDQEAYDVIQFKTDGTTSIYATYA